MSVLTHHNDIGRTGQNTGETILTPLNVNVNQFGKLFSLSVDGQLYAQPLYVPNITVGGSVHNLLIVATEADTVYAFDADSNTGANANPLWKASLVDAAHGAGAGETPMPYGATSSSCTDLTPQIGITSTPVIDPASGTIYVEAKSTNGVSYFHRLHALDLLTGNEKLPAPSPDPALITATITGSGAGSQFGQLTFDALHQLNRPGLLLLNGTVYIAYASHCDLGPYHGWVFAYDAATLSQKGVYNTAPDGSADGIWMSGAGIAADSGGALYMATGNGYFDVATTQLGDSIIKVGFLNGSLTALDYFAPGNQATLAAKDLDLGSGGVLVLPDQPGSHPHLLVEGSKEGRIYLIDRDVMTSSPLHYCSGCSTDPEIVEESSPGFLGPVFGMPAYWNGTVYWGANQDVIKAIPLSNGLLDFAHVTTAVGTYGYPGTTPAISANGNANGILWTIEFASSGTAVLHAYDASNITHELYNSTQAANNRDQAGPANKFAVPTIANGKVYVGTSTEVDVYGLPNGGIPTTETPVISPSSASVISSVQVTINDATPGATIYYTTDGTLASPTHGTVYTASFTLTASTTVQAMASSSGLANSAVASATYTVQPPTTIASLSLAPTSVTGGTTSQATVTLSASAPTAGISMSLSSDNTSVATVPSTVTVPFGKTAATFVVNTSAVAANSSAVITATYNGSQTAKLTVTPAPSSGGAGPALDARAFGDSATASPSVTTAAFSTTMSNELLLAFVATDFANGANTTVSGVSGGGLTWALVVRTNVQSGTAEIWRAFSPSPLTNITVTATLSQSVASSITVMSFGGVDISGSNGSGAIGATTSANAAAGAPTATLTTTRNNSWVFGVGNDYDNAIARTLGPAEMLVHQDLAPVGDTYWVQGQGAPTPVSGTAVTINDTAPVFDRYNLSLVEILPALTAISQPASIAATAGTPQSAAINTAFPTQLQATVKDAGNNPVSGVIVTFEAPTSGASGTFAGGANTATTNASGVATAAVFTANAIAGSYTVTATVPGASTPANFSLRNTSGAPASITSTAGTPQSAAINTAFAAQLQATVRDAANNPASGVSVTFTAPASGASGSFGGALTASVFTDANGVATAPVLTANNQTGSYVITANVSGVATGANFNLTNTAAVATAIAIDQNILKTQSATSSSITTPAFSTTSANELVLAFIATDGAASGTNAQVNTVTFTTGSFLTWTLVKRTNTARGTAEIWRAFASTPLSSVVVSATLNQNVASAFIDVITFTGATATGTGGSGAIGATGSGTGTSGAPNATLITTRSNSLVIGVGNDWDAATARAPATGQSIVNQYLATTGDTFWIQIQNAPLPQGTSVTISDTAPTTDQFNLSTCEIVSGP